jgi:hypothetical protein
MKLNDVVIDRWRSDDAQLLFSEKLLRSTPNGSFSGFFNAIATRIGCHRAKDIVLPLQTSLSFKCSVSLFSLGLCNKANPSPGRVTQM